MNFVEKEFITIPQAAGDQMNAWIMKPKTLIQIESILYLWSNIPDLGSQQVRTMG